MLTGQVCSSLTRIVVTQDRHDEFVDALVGSVLAGPGRGPIRPRHRRWDRWPSAGSATGSWDISRRAWPRARRWPPAAVGRRISTRAGSWSRPSSPTSTTASTIAREEIFGPVLSVIPAEDEQRRHGHRQRHHLRAQRLGVHDDVDRAREVAGQLRTGTVGHNSFRTDFAIAFGGFKQSGIGREGGTEGLLPFLETKTVILEEAPAAYRQADSIPDVNRERIERSARAGRREQRLLQSHRYLRRPTSSGPGASTRRCSGLRYWWEMPVPDERPSRLLQLPEATAG